MQQLVSMLLNVLMFVSGDGPLVMRIHAYLDRFGFINFGVFKRLKPLPGKTINKFNTDMYHILMVIVCNHV